MSPSPSSRRRFALLALTLGACSAPPSSPEAPPPSASSQAQTAGGLTLLADLAPGNASSAPGHFMPVGNTVFFAVDDGDDRRELWKTDGTAAGTVRIMDDGPSVSRSIFGTWAAVGNTLYFQSHVNGGQVTLWRSDGTRAGTQQVLDSTGQGLLSPDSPGALGNALIIFKSGLGSLELWRVEGALATRYWTTAYSTGGLTTGEVGGRRFFALGTSPYGQELWSTDGTAAGTGLVKDINPGTAGSDPQQSVAVGATLYFTANDGVLGRELWKTDGTAAGTGLVWDGRTGAASSGIQWMRPLGSMLVFAAASASGGAPLWVSQGTQSGTTPLLSASAVNAVSNTTGVAAGGVLYFTASTSAHGEELWKTDGTAAGTVLVKDVRPGSSGARIQHLSASGPLLYFTAEDGGGTRDLWRTDGTAGGTFKVRTGPLRIDVLGEPPAMVGLGNGALLFSHEAPGMGLELWRTDGTVAGTALFKDLRTEPASSKPGPAVDVGGTLMFSALDGHAGRRLWTSDGTAAGTRKVSDQPVADVPLMRLGGSVYFFTPRQGGGVFLWRSDGTAAGTVPVDESLIFSLPYLPQHGVVGGKLLFPTSVSSGTLYSEELWRTDGTAAGTAVVKDIHPEGSSFPGQLFTAGGWLYFTANDGVHGRELWRTDGTAEGTRMVGDLAPGGDWGLNVGPVVVGQKVFFVRPNPSGLWMTDGTAQGTVLVTGADSLEWYSLIGEVRGDLLFLRGANELWRTDGTAQGTKKLRDFPSPPRLFAKVHGIPYLLVTASQEGEGDEVWRTDGTPQGTELVAQVTPPALAQKGNPGAPVRYRGHLVFAADQEVQGREPWMLPLASLACPSTVVVEATSAAGATVTYPEATLAEDADPSLTVSYSHASGSAFPLGTTVVTAEAPDPRYPLSSCTFRAVVHDTTPPQLTCPADISVQEPSAGRGAVVTFQAAASDVVTAAPTVSASHPSGGTFPRGMTQVTVTATDTAGNTAQCSFKVEVRAANGQPPPGAGDGTDSGDQGCGCGAGPVGAAGWAWLTLLGLWASRRSR